MFYYKLVNHANGELCTYINNYNGSVASKGYDDSSPKCCRWLVAACKDPKIQHENERYSVLQLFEERIKWAAMNGVEVDEKV